MDRVQAGRIATRKGARVHLAIDGRIADRPQGVTYPVANPATTVAGAHLCRRCWTPARIAAAQQALITATGRDAEATRRMLSRVADANQTDAERAAMDDLAARIAETIANAAPILAQPIAARPRTWATLRDEFALTHQPAAA
jgi:hypothetical protein